MNQLTTFINFESGKVILPEDPSAHIAKVCV